MTAIKSELRKFLVPEVVFGEDARLLAGQSAKNLGARRVLLVSDPGVTAAGWASDVARTLEAAQLPYVSFCGVTPNPRAEEVMAGADCYRSSSCDVIIAVGGGSVIDCAKGIGIVVSNGGNILDYTGVDAVSAPLPPLVCIPTTAGTAADVSQFAIITDRTERTKVAIVSKAVVPDLSLVDPKPLLTTSAYLAACTGIDALVHAIEAFVSNASSPLTDVHALEAMHLVHENLLASLESPNDLQLRSRMMLGSLEAGLAFSNASLGAAHAMAHSLGGYLDLTHGECNAMVLLHVLDFNYPAADHRYDRVGEIFGLSLQGLSRSRKRTALRQAVGELERLAGITASLSDRGVKRSDVGVLAAHAVEDTCLVTNPRPANRRDLEVIFEEAL